MWGAPVVFDETDEMWGVYRFKRGFGGQVVQGLGAFDYPVNRPLYWLFTGALPHVRALMRRLSLNFAPFQLNRETKSSEDAPYVAK
jgi:lipid II:glycine glycyltransferase (peptidoglycan interpeptide bridge formation enzyme)